MEEVKGVDVVLVGEVDDAVDTVLLDVVERSVPLPEAAAAAGFRRRAPGPPPPASVVVVAAGGGDEVAVHDTAASEQRGSLARGGGAALDDEPEQRLRDEAERVGEAVQVVRLQRARAGWRHDDQGRRLPVVLWLRRSSSVVVVPDWGRRRRKGGVVVVREREVVEVELVEVAVREGDEAGDEAEEEAEQEARRREGPPRGEEQRRCRHRLCAAGLPTSRARACLCLLCVWFSGTSRRRGPAFGGRTCRADRLGRERSRAWRGDAGLDGRACVRCRTRVARGPPFRRETWRRSS